MKKLTILLSLMLLFVSRLFCQTNDDFKITIWAGSYALDPNTNNFYSDKYITGTSFYSSDLGVLSEDGFNVLYSYDPIICARTASQLKKIVLNIGANNMKGLFGISNWYRPTSTIYPNISGYNVYNEDSLNTYTLNYDKLYNEIFNIDQYRSSIYGIAIAGESDDTAGPTIDFSIKRTNACNFNTIKSAIPPQNVFDAISHFNSKKVFPEHKIIQNEGDHGMPYIVDDVLYFPSFPISDYFKGQNRGDIQIEHGYHTFDFIYYLSDATCIKQKTSGETVTQPMEKLYLGKFMNIDYEKKYYNNVQSEICLTSYFVGNDPELKCYQYTTSTSPFKTPNFNQIWFQAYTSIIHGANGVYFWGLNQLWKGTSDDGYRRINFENNNLNSRFDRSNFPVEYVKFLSHLANELAYLNSKGILEINNKNVIYSKTTSIDFMGIIPDITDLTKRSYIPETLTYENSRDLYDVIIENPGYSRPTTWSKTTNYPNTHHRDEFYGLRYTLRTNGNEVYMIISNPNPVVLTDVPLDFSKVANSIVQNATGLEVLFETKQSVTANDYKTVRNSVDWKNQIVKSSYSIPLTNKTCKLSFGPLDVHIIKFVSDPPHFDNQWKKTWTNNGNNWIGSWNMRSFDKYFPGDYDGDGNKELLCVQQFEYPKQFVNICKNDLDIMKGYWTNGGSDLLGNWTLNGNLDQFYVGNFDGDLQGQEEVLIIQKKDASALASLYKFNTTNKTWDRLWTNSGNGFIGSWPIKIIDKFVTGKFNNTAGIDELLCFNSSTNKTQLFRLNSGNWNSQYYNGGTFALSTWTINSNDSYIVGDFDADKKTEIICNNTPLMKMYKFNGSNWGTTPIWTETTTSGIAGYKSDLQSGDLDGDGRDELFGNAKTTNGWITTFYYSTNNNDFNWWWSSSADNYLDDWNITELRIATTFIPIKVKKLSSANILAIKEYSNTSHLASMYSYTPNSNNYLGKLAAGANRRYQIYVPMKSDVNISTCFSETKIDTKVNLLKIDSTIIATNDNITCSVCTPVNKASSLTSQILEQGYYYIDIYNLGTTIGNYRMDVIMENIYTLPFSVFGNTSNKPNSWVNTIGTNSGDRAYKFYLPAATAITASLCDPYTNYNSILEIFKGDKTGTGYKNDNGTCSYNSQASVVTTSSLAAGYYYAVIDGNGATGNFKLSITDNSATKSAVLDSSDEESNKIQKQSTITENISIYPNPNNGHFTFEFYNSIDLPYMATIYNSSGSAIKSLENISTTNEIDISSYPKGFYYIMFNYQDRSEVRKLIFE